MANVNLDVFTPKMRFLVILVSCDKYNPTFDSYSCIIEFIKLVASLAFYHFSSTRLINSIKYEHYSKILYKNNHFAIKDSVGCIVFLL